MSHNQFDRPRGSIFSHRLAEPDPNKYFRKVRTEKSPSSEEKVPTLFDVQDYFVKTQRSDLLPELHRYDLLRVEKALLYDMEKTTDEKHKTLIRRYLLAAATQAYPLPAQSPENIAANIAYLKTELEMQKNSKRAASDDTEIEDEELALCDELNLYIRYPHNFKDKQGRVLEILRFIEDKQRSAIHRHDSSRTQSAKRTATDYLMHIRLLRDGAYWRFLYPHVKFPGRHKTAA